MQRLRLMRRAHVGTEGTQGSQPGAHVAHLSLHQVDNIPEIAACNDEEDGSGG